MLPLETVFKTIRHYLAVALERSGVNVNDPDTRSELQSILYLGSEYAHKQEDRIAALERRVAELEQQAQRPPVVG